MVTALEVRSMDIKKVVDDPDWQKLREGFVGTWKAAPVHNTALLRGYVGDMSDPLKVRRVLNYLTGSGFRIGVISHPDITKLRDEIRAKWKHMLSS